MIPREPFPFKNLVFKVLIFCAGLLLADALFVAATSLWVAFVHQDRQGSWVPLFAGGLLAVLAVWLFIRFIRALLRAMKRSDILRS
jgi:cytochrome c biogenesis protein CcdA